MRTKFVIVAEPHSGAEAVHDALAAHPNVRIYGELFNRTDYGLMGRLADKGVLIKVGEDPIEFLESKILTDYDPDALAIGFTLLYDQAKSESWNKVWRYVRKEFKVIHVKRPNLLDCYLEPLPGPTHIEPADLQRAFDSSRAARRENDIYFRHTETLEMDVDQMIEDMGRAVGELCDFLKVPSGFIDELNAVATQDQAEKIVNYDDLKGRFEGKPEGEFFR